MAYLQRIPIVLDCDPGHDDAIAILLAAAAPELDLRAITVVAGNGTLPHTLHAACAVCTIGGITSIPIAAGMDRPLVRPLVTAPDIHGDTALGGPVLPTPTVHPIADHAVDVIIREAHAADGELVLVPTGPLTNIAAALRKDPSLTKLVKRIVLMGGAIGLGNHTPAAEFNIYVDPEAAAIVFTSGIPLTMIGLEVTHEAQPSPAIRQQIVALGTPVGQFVDDLLTFFAGTYKRVFNFDTPPVHDPCAVAYVIDPTLVQTRRCHVAIETAGLYTVGRTVVDLLGVTRLPANAEVGLTLDRDRFWNKTVAALARYR